MDDLNANQWLDIFSQEFRKNHRNYLNHIERQAGEDYESDIFQTVLGGSQGVSYARQRLPHNLGETAAGRWLRDRLPDDYRQYVGKVPLGGYSQQTKEEFSKARADDPELRSHTLEVGRVPIGGEEVAVGDNVRAASAQAAGAIAADVATDGLRNIWWFLNAPQALAQIAILSATHRAGSEHKPYSANVPLLKNRAMRMAATLPAVIGVSMAVGNAGRQPGYKAAVPSEADPRQTADPLAEFGSRYILGRSGGLLPYEEFVKERPDVSRSDYEQYKQYLFGNALPLKATLDGIQGPEVTFLGKSIPVLTGILPAVAAVMGARHGVKRAAANLAGYEYGSQARTGPDKLRAAVTLRRKAKEAKIYEEKGPNAYDRIVGGPVPEDTYENLYNQYAALQRSNESKVLRNALLYSGGSMSAAALAGQTLESIRRALKGNAPVQEDPLENLAPATNSI